MAKWIKYFFWPNQGGMHIRTECGTLKRLAVPTKTPVIKQQSHTQEEQETTNQRALSETMLSLRKKNEVRNF